MFLIHKGETMPASLNFWSLFASAHNLEHKATQITPDVNSSVRNDKQYLSLAGTDLHRSSPSVWLIVDSNPYRLTWLGILQYTGLWDLPVSSGG